MHGTASHLDQNNHINNTTKKKGQLKTVKKQSTRYSAEIFIFSHQFSGQRIHNDCAVATNRNTNDEEHHIGH
jgi:hypothetical protein